MQTRLLSEQMFEQQESVSVIPNNLDSILLPIVNRVSFAR